MPTEPGDFSVQRIAATVEGPELRTVDGSQICPPATLAIGFNVTASRDVNLP